MNKNLKILKIKKYLSKTLKLFVIFQKYCLIILKRKLIQLFVIIAKQKI